MIVKMNRTGRGGGSGPTQYLLGKDGNREGAELLRGEPGEIKDLIDSNPHSNKYLSGGLHFKESDLPDDVKNEIMDKFETTLLPSLNQNNYSILWVQHRDKNLVENGVDTGEKRLELNFVIPNIELTTGKTLDPYYHNRDVHRVNTFKELINEKYQLDSPDHVKNWQTNTLDLRNKETFNETLKTQNDVRNAITESVSQQFVEGNINNRDETVNYLKELGLDIKNVAKQSVSIANPIKENGQNIRLKGAFFKEDFTHETRQLLIESERDRRQNSIQSINEIRARDTSTVRSFERKLEESVRIAEQRMEDKFGISKEFNRENQSIQHTDARGIEKSSDRNELDLSSYLERASKIREQYGRDLQRSEQQDEKSLQKFQESLSKNPSLVDTWIGNSSSDSVGDRLVSERQLPNLAHEQSNTRAEAGELSEQDRQEQSISRKSGVFDPKQSNSERQQRGHVIQSSEGIIEIRDAERSEVVESEMGLSNSKSEIEEINNDRARNTIDEKFRAFTERVSEAFERGLDKARGFFDKISEQIGFIRAGKQDIARQSEPYESKARDDFEETLNNGNEFREEYKSIERATEHIRDFNDKNGQTHGFTEIFEKLAHNTAEQLQRDQGRVQEVSFENAGYRRDNEDLQPVVGDNSSDRQQDSQIESSLERVSERVNSEHEREQGTSERAIERDSLIESLSSNIDDFGNSSNEYESAKKNENESISDIKRL